MSTTTTIEWTDATWNPIRGCSRVSEGCRNCYAEKVAFRFSGAGQPYEGLAHKVNGHASWTGKVEFVEEHLLDPLKWGPVITGCLTGREVPHAQKGHCPKCTERPRRIFVNSMSDLFHENVPDEWIDKIFAVMALCPQHQFQILTKRPERMLAYLSSDQNRINVLYRVLCHDPRAIERGEEFRTWPLPNAQLGVSVEDQETADERIPPLLQTPAAVRFISAEPSLGAIDLTNINQMVWFFNYYQKSNPSAALRDFNDENYPKHCRLDALRGHSAHSIEQMEKLDWVICGGESGRDARPMHPDWARSLRDQCQAAGVPFFFKQWGEWICPTQFGEGNFDPRVHGVICRDGRFFPNCDFAPGERSKITCRVGKKAAGALLDGREWREFPSSAVRA